MSLEEQIKSLAGAIRDLAKELTINTSQMAKLKVEIRRTREVEEKNTAFLQEIIKDLLAEKQVVENNRWETAKVALNWGLKIGGVVILGYLAVRGVIPS